MTGNCQVRCGAGENSEITSKNYLSLFGQIPDFDKVIAFVRSMGMSLNVIVQNLAQLKARYEKTWEVITGNCDSLLFLGGKEESTLKSISETLGKETIDIHGYNHTKGRNSSTSENNSLLGRELMQVNEIATMPITDCILIIRSHNPFYCKKYPLEQHPNYQFLADSAKTDEEKEERTFKVSSIHAISVKELQKKEENVVDTNINNNSDVQIEDNISSDNELDSIKEIVLDDINNVSTSIADILKLLSSTKIKSYGEEKLSNENVEYGKVEMSFDSLDFGSPIRKEITYEADTSSLNGEDVEITDIVQYDIPDETTEIVEDISLDSIETVVISTSETVSDGYSDVDYEDEFNF